MKMNVRRYKNDASMRTVDQLGQLSKQAAEVVAQAYARLEEADERELENIRVIAEYTDILQLLVGDLCSEVKAYYAMIKADQERRLSQKGFKGFWNKLLESVKFSS